MPTLIRLEAGAVYDIEDSFATIGDDDPVLCGPVIVSSARFQRDAEALLGRNHPVGVLLRSDEGVESLAYDLPRLSLIALEFPKFRDGRPYTAAQLLRTRYGFGGEVRAVGDVLREQAHFMVRCGFDAFVPADGSTAEHWARATGLHRHVYQRAADGRPAAFLERAG